jgi:heme exporter protein D
MKDMSKPQISSNDKVNNSKLSPYIPLVIAIAFILVIRLMHQSSKRRRERLRKAIQAEKARERTRREEDKDRDTQCMKWSDKKTGVWEGIKRIEREMMMRD